MDGLLKLSEDGKTLLSVVDKDMNTLVVPSGVRTIDKNALKDCYSLYSIYIPDSVTEISVDVLTSCSFLQSIHVDEDNPQYASERGSLYNKSKTKLIYCLSGYIPDSVTEIGEFAFFMHEYTESFDVPDGVTKIGNGAFWGCFELETISIPSSVTEIGEVVFSSCYKLQNIRVAEDNPQYTSLDGVLYNKDKTKLLWFPSNYKERHFSIPDSVTTITYDAFDWDISIESIEIPGSVTEFEDESFTGCFKLQNIHVAEDNPLYASVDGVLYNKDKTTLLRVPCLYQETHFVVPDGVTTIGKHAFYHCNLIETIVIPDSVTTIEVYKLFENCESLKSVDVPGSVTGVGRGLIKVCSHIKDE